MPENKQIDTNDQKHMRNWLGFGLKLVKLGLELVWLALLKPCQGLKGPQEPQNGHTRVAWAEDRLNSQKYRQNWYQMGQIPEKWVGNGWKWLEIA